MIVLLDSILEYSSISKEKYTLSSVDLNQCIDDAIQDMQLKNLSVRRYYRSG